MTHSWNTWKMAFLENAETAHVLGWNHETTMPPKKIPLHLLREEDVQLLLVGPKTEYDLFQDFLKEEQRYYPVALSPVATSDEMLALSPAAREEILKKEYEKWIMSNNLQTIEELFPFLEHMQKMRVEQYGLFFEELWFFFKRNLGFNHLRLIFHDLKDVKDKDVVAESGAPSTHEKGGKEKDRDRERDQKKSKLELVALEGKRHPHGKSGEELEQKLFQLYPYHPEGPFYSLQFVEEKGHLILSGTIRGSSFFMMGSTLFLNRLQRAVVHTFMEGLNQSRNARPSKERPATTPVTKEAANRP